jgi:hypothetical protein
LAPYECRGPGAVYEESTKVGDVEDAYAGANGVVFRDDAFVLHGHRPSTEVGEPGPELEMEVMQR